MDADRCVRGGLAALFVLALGAVAVAEDGSTVPQPERAKFRWPLRGAVVEPFRAGKTDGIEIAAGVGEPVHAAADGLCIVAGDELMSYGKLAAIRHEGGYVTVYARLSEIQIKQGDQIRRGQIIGKSGQSGETASPRLHFELRKDGKPVDPVKSLVPM